MCCDLTCGEEAVGCGKLATIPWKQVMVFWGWPTREKETNRGIPQSFPFVEQVSLA